METEIKGTVEKIIAKVAEGKLGRELAVANEMESRSQAE